MAGAPKQDAAAILQQLNLAALRTRMHDLQATISRIMQSIHANPSSKWVDVLDQFAVVNLELLSLVDDIKPMLRAFLVYPKNVTAANAPILPIMLSSKLLPELEAEESALRQNVLAPMSNLSLNAQSDKLQKQIELVRTACDTAEKLLADARKAFGLGSRQGGHAIPTIEKAYAARILEQEKQLHAAANFGDGLRMPNEQRTASLALPPHIAAALASADEGLARAPPVRPATPQQILPSATLNGSPAATQARPGSFGDMQQQQQQQQQVLQAMQKAKFQQKPFAQQLRQPSTPPLPQMQLANPNAPQSIPQQPSKMHQFPQHLQLNQQQHAQLQQQMQERHFHQLQTGQMRPQMGAYGNPQQALNMMANMNQPRMQYGAAAAMSSQSQRNQMLPDPLYGQTAAGLAFPMQQQQQQVQLNAAAGQAPYNLQPATNYIPNHPQAMLNQAALLTHNTLPTFNQVRQHQQQPPSQ